MIADMQTRWEPPAAPIGANVRGQPVYGRDLSEYRAISQLGPNWVHVRVRGIDNIVVNQDIAQCNKTSLGI